MLQTKRRLRLRGQVELPPMLSKFAATFLQFSRRLLPTIRPPALKSTFRLDGGSLYSRLQRRQAAITIESIIRQFLGRSFGHQVDEDSRLARLAV